MISVFHLLMFWSPFLAFLGDQSEEIGDFTFISPKLDSIHETCPVDTPPSCSIKKSPDSCCYEGINGLFLQTQFWDYSPGIGANDSWTLHGLWSDKCLGGFNQFCNPSWEISDVPGILKDLGEDKLLKKMQKNWLNLYGNDASLWEHEFNKHGTCMSTVNPSCYPKDAPQYQYVADFYRSAVGLWETLPSFDFLADAGIYPSEEDTWTVEQWNTALSAHVDNKVVHLGCDHNNHVNELWYFFYLKGSVASGKWIPTDSITSSTCKPGFKWIPKTYGKKPSPGKPNPAPGPGKHLNIDGHRGCLISDGSWYSSGTCATYRITETVGGVQLQSSKGKCGIVDGSFKCGPSITAGDFTIDKGKLAYGGSIDWSADHEPSKFGRVLVSPDSEGDIKFTISIQ